MVEKQQENVVSQPMGAWEGRSAKIIRNCLRQLSCAKKKKKERMREGKERERKGGRERKKKRKGRKKSLQCLMRYAFTSLVLRFPCTCYTLTLHSIDLFQLGVANNSCHVILSSSTKSLLTQKFKKNKKRF